MANQTPHGNRDRDRAHARNFFAGADAIVDNHTFFEWAEGSRRILHAAALELGIVASELDAKLRTVNNGVVLLPGLTARARARQVAKPVQQAGNALLVASQYIITSTNRFEAAFMPELESAGSRRPHSSFVIKG